MASAPDGGVSKELIDKSLDFLVDQLQPIYPPVLVIGFGGDPIEAFDYVMYAQEKVASDKKYAAVKVMMSSTHGQTLTETHIQYLEKHGGYISFSIDGTRENHLRTRASRGAGVDSYSRVLKAYEKAKDRLFCSVNGTVTPDGNLAEDLTHLYDLGFRTITMLPVRPAETQNYEFNDPFLEALKNQYSNLIKHFKTLDDQKLAGILSSITSEDYFNKFFNRIVFKKNFHRKCGAAFNFVYVSAQGQITPCASFRPYQGEQYVIGHLDTGLDLEKIAPIFGFSTHHVEPCKSCEVESVCSGFCFYNSLQATGRVDKPFEKECELAKHLVYELRDFMAYLESERPQVLKAYKDHCQKIEALDRSFFEAH